MDDLFTASGDPTIMPWPNGAKAIILVDLDAFFASVEQLDHPEWRGKPVIVGGSPEMRGVVSTASYEARKFGVHSAMPSAQAVKLCPEAIWVRGNYRRYGEMSRKVMDIIRDFTPFVQQVSIDEAFADITPSTAFPEHPAKTAADIQSRIFELGITCSIGLATNKSLAKMASEVDKPRGLTVVYPGSEAAFVAEMPVSAMSGIGPAAAQRLTTAGFADLGQVYAAGRETLRKLLGKAGEVIFERFHGKDDLAYVPAPPKSVSHDVTFPKDLADPEEAQREMLAILAEVCRRLRKTGLFATTLTVKVHYDISSGKSAQCRLPEPTADEYAMKDAACALLDSLWIRGLTVRLLSVGVSGLVGEPGVQESLFAEEEEKARSTSALVEAEDRINARFGKGAVQQGRSLYSQSRDLFRKT